MRKTKPSVWKNYPKNTLLPLSNTTFENDTQHVVLFTKKRLFSLFLNEGYTVYPNVLGGDVLDGDGCSGALIEGSLTTVQVQARDLVCSEQVNPT